MQNAPSGITDTSVITYSNELKIALRSTNLPEITSISPTYALAYQPGLDV